MHESTDGTGQIEEQGPRVTGRLAAVPGGIAADPRGPGGEGTEPVPGSDRRGAQADRPHPASLRRAGTAVAVAVVLLALVSATRLLADWEESRWWLVSVIGLGAAAVAGLVALVQAVSGAGEAHRRPHMSGTSVGVALAVVATLVLAGIGLRGVDDWYDLDVPAAWGRLRESTESESRTVPELEQLDDGDADGTGVVDGLFGGAIDDAEDLTGGEELVRTSARIGDCRTGDAADPGPSVDCQGPHRLEVTGQVDLSESAADDLDAEGRIAAAGAACEADPEIGPPPEGAETEVLVPGDLEWEGGFRDALCVAVWPVSVEGSQTG